MKKKLLKLITKSKNAIHLNIKMLFYLYLCFQVNRLPKIDENEHNTNSYQEINNKIENISIQMENNIISRRSPYKRNNYLKEQQQCQSPAPSSPKDTSNDSFINHIILQKEEKEHKSLPMSYLSQQQQPKQKKKVHIDTTNLLKKYEHNSDEDEEFDWFEDDHQQDRLKRSKSSIRRAKHKNIKQPCCWHYLTPYMKRFLICFIGSFTFIIIAVLAHIYLPEGTIQQQNNPNFKNVSKNVQMWMWWAAFMWSISWVTSIFSQLVPSIVRYFTKSITGAHSENVKTRLLVCNHNHKKDHYYNDHHCIFFIQKTNINIYINFDIIIVLH